MVFFHMCSGTPSSVTRKGSRRMIQKEDLHTMPSSSNIFWFSASIACASSKDTPMSMCTSMSLVSAPVVASRCTASSLTIFLELPRSSMMRSTCSLLIFAVRRSDAKVCSKKPKMFFCSAMRIPSMRLRKRGTVMDEMPRPWLPSSMPTFESTPLAYSKKSALFESFGLTTPSRVMAS